MEFNVKSDVDSVRRALLYLRDDVVDAAAVSALNRVSETVKGDAVKRVGELRNLPKKIIRESIKRKPAWRGHLTTKVWALGKPWSLRLYGAEQTAHGVSVQIRPGGGRKIVHVHGNRAFVFRKGKRGQRQGGIAQGPIFARVGPARYPIHKLHGPSIPTAFVNRFVLAWFRSVARRVWIKRFDHELSRRMKGVGFEVRIT